MKQVEKLFHDAVGPMLNQADAAKIEAAIKTAEADAKAVVKMIEGPDAIQTTQNNYGAYLAILGALKTRVARFVVAIALERNGGNSEGIMSAMRIIG